ncbi:hypothetical protein LSCM1_01625 [Leishmania martiniquensis]|uniref:BTB domain-containing protein n=1 Tax=Leishmania martiniquensis TaxID=1580590 RepID=A0A836KF00_9TRYP|nr:hypothetical protein LSCM1_01625 [Leishmania martiniquensis]
MDSDEEPPAAAANAVPTTVAREASPLVIPLPGLAAAPRCRRESDTLAELCAGLKRRYESLSTLPPPVPPVVGFCVGGKRFALSRALLEKDPSSLLFSLAAQHYCSPLPGKVSADASARGRKRCRGVDGEMTADSVIAIPGRNARLFGMLLNLLRGYRNAIPEDWIDACRDEATYYGLLGSWNARFHIASSHYYFRNPMHNSKLVSDAVLGVASDFFSTGQHHIDFSVSQCDRVAVGMMSSSPGPVEELVTPLHDGNNGAFYWNDGKLSFYLGEPRVVETGLPYPAGAIVRIIFDADERIVRWIVNGEYCVAMERLPAGRQYAFSAIAARSSQVTIVAT